MSASRETADASKCDKETNSGTVNTQTPTPDQGKEGRGNNSGNRRGGQILSRNELVQLHTVHRYFKGGVQ